MHGIAHAGEGEDEGEMIIVIGNDAAHALLVLKKAAINFGIILVHNFQEPDPLAKEAERINLLVEEIIAYKAPKIPFIENPIKKIKHPRARNIQNNRFNVKGHRRNRIAGNRSDLR